MNLSRALSEKNRLARKIKEIQKKIESHNSLIKGNTPVYSIENLLKELDANIAELTEIKTRISEANLPVQNKIFRLSELKSQAAFLKNLNIKEGKILDERWNAEVTEWVSSLGSVERDKMVETIETEISELQAELDQFNFETKI